MPRETSFTLTIDSDLQTEFLAEAEATHREASEIIRELIRDFVQRQKEARAYEDFLRGKVERARRSAAAGHVRAHAEVEADFAARRGA